MEPSNFAPRLIHRGTEDEYSNTQVRRHADSSTLRCGRKLETTLVSVSRGMDESVVRPYNGTLLGHKRKEILTHPRAWTNPENIMLSERSQIQWVTDL